MGQKAMKVASTDYGMSSLNAWNRFLQCGHISSTEFPFKKWSAERKKTSCDNHKKKHIPKILKDKVGIVVNVSK